MVHAPTAFTNQLLPPAIQIVNAAGICNDIAAGNSLGIMNKKRELTAVERAECEALAQAIAAYNAGKPRHERLTQEAAAHDLGILQGSLNAYLKGRNALNAKVAAYFSMRLSVPVSSFSPRLAVEIEQLAQAAEPARTEQTDVPQQARRAAMLAALATPRSQEALERITRAANEGRLTEADLILLEQIASRFESSTGTEAKQTPPANGNQRLKERLRNNDPGTQR